MAHALALGRRGLGRTWPNPAVGCVLVKSINGKRRIIGRGVTGPGGRPHAETQALQQAGAAAAGSQAYVSLEPCAHHGKTPPCADALIKARVRQVFYPFDDPDPRVRGKGRLRLQDGSIAVTTGLLADQAGEDLKGFVTRVKRGRPFVTLKMALSHDGMIAARPGVSTTITGPLAKARSHLMRAQSDGILVGVNTAKIDDPALTCRLPGLEDRSPVRIIADARGELPIASQLTQSAGTIPVWLLVDRKIAANEPQHLRDLAGHGVIIIPSKVNAGRIDLKAAAGILGERGLTSVIIEGGAAIAKSALLSNIADEVVLFQAPRELGAQGLGAFGDLPLSHVTNSEQFQNIEEMRLAEDRFTRYKNVQQG